MFSSAFCCKLNVKEDIVNGRGSPGQRGNDIACLDPGRSYKSSEAELLIKSGKEETRLPRRGSVSHAEDCGIGHSSRRQRFSAFPLLYSCFFTRKSGSSGSSGKASENAGCGVRIFDCGIRYAGCVGADFCCGRLGSRNVFGFLRQARLAGAASSVSTAGQCDSTAGCESRLLHRASFLTAAIFAVDSEKTGWNYDNQIRRRPFIYLTFGRSKASKETQSILDTLDKYGVKATFL